MTIDFTTEDQGVSDRWTPIATRFCGGSIDPPIGADTGHFVRWHQRCVCINGLLRSNCLLSKWIPLESQVRAHKTRWERP